MKTTALLAVTAILALAGPIPAESAVPGAAGSAATVGIVAEPCDWDTEYHRTLTLLGENEADWKITPLPVGRGGKALMEQQRAEIDPDVDCSDVSSVVKHEWAHLQQARLYGSHQAVLNAYQDPSGAVMEFAADCTAWRLGATYQPYLSWGTRACDESWPRAEARRLIRYVTPGLTPIKTYVDWRQGVSS